MMRGLRNSCAAISRLVMPSATSPAICRSSGVSPAAVNGSRLRAVSPVAQLGLGAAGPRDRAQPLEQLQRRMQAGARVAALPLPPQRLAVEQVGAGPLQRR